MNLIDAMLCLDCDEISPKATHCPLCTSSSVMDLSKWIAPRDQAREVIGQKWNIEIHNRTREVMQEVEAMWTRIRMMMPERDDNPLGCGA